MILKKLRAYLDSHNIKYVVVSHSQAFTAQEIAQMAHIPGKELAKTVMVKINNKMVMVVIPASDIIDFELLKNLTDAESVELSDEYEFTGLFPDCEVGAMPPFGNLYDLDVIVAEHLTHDTEIAFNAGTHKELVKMSCPDFLKLVQPKVLNISMKKRSPTDNTWRK
jgi:Ala-tRNA(Pro) deacylase